MGKIIRVRASNLAAALVALTGSREVQREISYIGGCSCGCCATHSGYIGGEKAAHIALAEGMSGGEAHRRLVAAGIVKD